MSLSPEQLKERLNYITATDVAVICGLSPWKNKVELWQEKTGQVVAKDISNNPAVRAGIYLEPVVARWFSDDTGKELKTDERLKVHKTIPYMAAHIDRIVTGENAALECKTTRFAHGWGEQGENIIPDYYLVQCAHEAMVWDLDRVYCAVLIGGSDFRHYVYERNDKLEQLLVERCGEFWRLVKSETPPEPTTGDEVISLYGYQTSNEPACANDEMCLAVEQLRDTKAIIKQAQDEQKKLEDKIKSFMCKKDTLLGQDGKICVSWKASKDSVRFDAEIFKDENSELYQKYATKIVKGSRRFIIK